MALLLSVRQRYNPTSLEHEYITLWRVRQNEWANPAAHQPHEPVGIAVMVSQEEILSTLLGRELFPIVLDRAAAGLRAHVRGETVLPPGAVLQLEAPPDVIDAEILEISAAVHTGTRLIELDFSGIEAVLVGWFARDPQDIRIAKLGMHAFVTSHLVKTPVDLSLSDAEVAKALKAVKSAHKPLYDRAKRVVHGTGYGMTPQGMVLMFPKDFPTLAAAKHVQQVYFTCAPAVPKWQQATVRRAQEQSYLGGPPRAGHTVLTDDNAHPFGYRHDFFGVLSYRPIDERKAALLQRQHYPVAELHGRWFQIVPGEDAKSCIAFYPQSTASGILKEVMIRLFVDPAHPSYIGDAYFGRTPLRAPIHDSLLMEVPPRQIDRVLEAAYGEMLRPIAQMPLPASWGIGSHLTIGVEGKIGANWEAMQAIVDPPQGGRLDPEAPVFDKTYFPATAQEEEDVEALAVEYRAGEILQKGLTVYV